MSPGGKGTSSGKVLEGLLKPVLEMNGYEMTAQTFNGSSPWGGRNITDYVVIRPDGTRALVSCKWQQVGGTAEEKLPMEVVKLLAAKDSNPGLFDKVYIVLGGEGFNPKLKAWLIAGGLCNYMHRASEVQFVTADKFIALANNGKL